MERWAALFALLPALVIGAYFYRKQRTKRARRLADRAAEIIVARELGRMLEVGSQIAAWSTNGNGNYERRFGTVVSGPHIEDDEIYYRIAANNGNQYDKPVLRRNGSGAWVKTSIDITPVTYAFGA